MAAQSLPTCRRMGSGFTDADQFDMPLARDPTKHAASQTSWFLWAKWLAAEWDVRHGPALTSSNDWDVVYVFENTIDEREDEFLRVLVVGVEGAQSIENFEWGPGPLTPPQ